MKIAIVGSEGYVGRALQQIIEKHSRPVTTIKHDIFVYNQHDNVKSPVNNEEDPAKVAEWINDEKVDAVIWLAAYAHDPQKFITLEEHLSNNTVLPAKVYAETSCRFVIPSSLSVHSDCSYAQAKRRLEQHLVCMSEFSSRVHILRFGTLYGVVDLMHDPESFRSHLVLNSMCYTALAEGKIYVAGGSQRRPVLPVFRAASSLLCAAIDQDSTRGTIHNFYETCGTLDQMAKAVQDAAKDLGHNAEIIHAKAEDTRNYGWGIFKAPLLRPNLYATIRWLEKNMLEVGQYRMRFPGNLYDFVERRRQ
jgi:nucleoside-diphosphate-sugar epimerase